MHADDLALLQPHFERVELKLKHILFEADAPIEHVHFFLGGLSSEIATLDGKGQLEIGCVGREGFSGHSVLLGVEASPHFAFMQASGSALRIRSDILLSATDTSKRLRMLLLRFIHVLMVQIASSAVSDARFTVRQRLARWLLMCQDRIGDELPLTHEFLALMLGVRRSGVTEMIHVLEGENLIRAVRALITVKDRQGLIDVAAGCYGLPESEYRRLINPNLQSLGTTPRRTAS